MSKRLVTLLAYQAARPFAVGRRLGNIHASKKLSEKPTYIPYLSNHSRSFAAMSSDRVVTYEDVVKMVKRPEVYLIDVREPSELQETGSIPNCINIPLGDVGTALKSNLSEDFHKKYGKSFPSQDKELVFYCKMGGRAAKGMDQAIQLGFYNSKVYKGSWQDWASNQTK